MNDCEVAIAAAAEGAAVVCRHFGSTLQRLEKGVDDFATHADIEAEQAMLAIVSLERPEDSILAEESGRSGAQGGSRTWLIDPLCGTLNYSVRMCVTGVNVALMDDGRISAAAVADPFNREIFWSDGISAFLRKNEEDTALVPDASSRLVDLNLDPPFPSAPGFRAVDLAADPEFSERFRPRVVSSSVALAWVATGQRAAYITDGDVRHSVHFAAGIALCEAAGCMVTDLQGLVGPGGTAGLVAAADSATHAALMELVKKHRTRDRSSTD
jgi:myo-inositol-1(or 4)-monophosphatase